MLSEKQKLAKIMKLGVEITEVKDVDVLLERLLHEARHLVNADAGSIYIKEGENLKFSYTQNDTLQKRLPPTKKLIYSTFSLPINNKSISGYVANTGETLNIPDVYKLRAGLPFSFNKSYDDLSGYRTQSMLTFPLKTSRDATIGVLQLINGKNASGKTVPFWKKDQPLILHFANMAAVAIERAQMTRTMILRTIKMAELRDPKETGAHVNRVAAYAVAIYEAWAAKRGTPHDEVEKKRDVLRMAAMLHDVGKVAISDTILKKPTRLSEEERTTMKQHALMGARLFSEHYSEFDEAAAIVALNHHEKWDGTGYPGHINPKDGSVIKGHENNDGKPCPKQGKEIPIFGRVVALADVYDALSSHRAYKEKWEETRVLDEMKFHSGTHFDPEIVEVFFSCLDTIHSISERYPNSE
ncbi:MAG TPA: HD domain-containing phosphohydrolase [Nitrospirota bacterium]|nr:HD domain-containing phosphohydrolase [Nitrospirota bacterium]